MGIKQRDTKSEDDRLDTHDAVSRYESYVGEALRIVLRAAIDRGMSNSNKAKAKALLTAAATHIDKFPTL